MKVFNLPYSVKVNDDELLEESIEKSIEIIEPIEEPIETPIEEIKNNIQIMTNFSIVIISNHEEENLLNLLNSLENFKNMGGEICILSTTPIENDSIFKYGKVEINSNFTKTIDFETARLINEKFNVDGVEYIVQENDKYSDYSELKNYAATIPSNDMILILDSVDKILNFNIDQIQIYVNEGWNRLKLDKNYSFYNRKDYRWCDIISKDLLLLENREERKLTLSTDIIKIEYPKNKDYLFEFCIKCLYDESNIKMAQLLGIELKNHGYLNSAIREFSRHTNMPAPSVDKGESLILIGDCLIIQERDNDAIDYYHKSYLEYSNRRAALYKMGEYFFIKKMWDKTIHYIEGLLHITNFDPDIDEPFHYKDGPYSMLYIAYWWYGDIKKGKYYFDKALEIDPYNPIYLRETQFHYRYVGTNIKGKLTFKEIQFLYNESKKFNSILEIKCENGRGTHALLNGCKGYVTVVTQKTENSEFLSNVGSYGNIKVLEMSSEDAKKDLNGEIFDMIFINGDNHDEIKKEIMLWETQCRFLMCGYNYSTNKSDNWGYYESFEICGTEDHLWYKNMSEFHKFTVYKRKEK